jgi:hypothetical protein
MTVTYDEVDSIVQRINRKWNQHAFWEGWTICVFKPSRNAYTNPMAEFKNGSWGFVNRIPVSDDGTWSVPNVYVK